MPDRSDMFLRVMAAIGVVGVLAFVVYLVSHYLRRSQTAVAEGAPDALDTSGPRWFEVLLALLLLAVVTAVLLWPFAGGAVGAAFEIPWGAPASKEATTVNGVPLFSGRRMLQ